MAPRSKCRGAAFLRDFCAPRSSLPARFCVLDCEDMIPGRRMEFLRGAIRALPCEWLGVPGAPQATDSSHHVRLWTVKANRPSPTLQPPFLSWADAQVAVRITAPIAASLPLANRRQLMSAVAPPELNPRSVVTLRYRSVRSYICCRPLYGPIANLLESEDGRAYAGLAAAQCT